MGYNKGNYEKHTTKNPIKRFLVERLTTSIIDACCKYARGCGRSTLLDAGCGEGFFLRRLNPELFDLHGCDVEEEAIRIASQHCAAQLTVSDLKSLDYSDKSFDVVVCSEVLEHIHKPEEAFQELLRVCKDTLIITVPHEPWFCICNLLSLNNVHRLGNPIDHINHWTFKTFCKWIYSQSKHYEAYYFKSFPWLGAIIRKRKDN